MRERLGLPLLLLTSGTFVIGIHDYAYRRAGGDDFELDGLLSHAGADMVILTLTMIVTAVIWLNKGFRE